MTTEALLAMLGNYKTTLLGFALGVLYYLSTLGAALPHDSAGWLHLVVSALLAGLGYVAKDATTGSRPPVVLLALGIGLALTGCATPFGMSGSAAQLHELIKDKNASCTSVTGVYLGATIKVVGVNIDKGQPPAGGTAKIKGDNCDTEISAPPLAVKP